MLQSPDSQKNSQFAPAPSYTPVKTSTAPLEQATIGRTLVIKGEVSGNESLFVDGRIEGTINIPDNRVTIGRNGIVAADVNAKEVVIMGKVTGNVDCSDRVDIRSEGSLTGDIHGRRISVEDGALLRGSVQLTPAEQKQEKSAEQKQEKSVAPETPKALTAGAGK